MRPTSYSTLAYLKPFSCLINKVHDHLYHPQLSDNAILQHPFDQTSFKLNHDDQESVGQDQLQLESRTARTFQWVERQQASSLVEGASASGGMRTNKSSGPNWSNSSPRGISPRMEEMRKGSTGPPWSNNSSASQSPKLDEMKTSGPDWSTIRPTSQVPQVSPSSKWDGQPDPTSSKNTWDKNSNSSFSIFTGF